MRCGTNSLTEKYQGYIKSAHFFFSPTLPWLSNCKTNTNVITMFFSLSLGSYIQAAEKSFSMVTGGRTREAAALAWERQGPAPDRTSYKNWAKSVLENPAVVESKVESSATVCDFSHKSCQKADVVLVCDFPDATHHRFGFRDPMRCHQEAAPEESPAAVLGWVWYLQMCSVPQQRQASSLRDRVQMCLPDWHVWLWLRETSSWLQFRYCKRILVTGKFEFQFS